MANFENRTLFENNNLPVLRALDTDSIDLIYLDPPFNSNRNYAAPIGSQAAGAAFKDTWTLSDIDIAEHGELAEQAPSLHTVIQAAREAHGKGMQSYLIMMSTRLLEMERILKDTGSIYLHCDPTASHYLKLIMDSIFGKNNFRNEINWKRKTGRAGKTNRFGTSCDVIFWYSKSRTYTYNLQYRESNPEYIRKMFRHVDENGRRYQIDNLASPNPRPNLTYEYKGYKPPAKGWAISREKMEQWDREGRLHFPKSPDGRIRRKRYLDELKGEEVPSLWDDIPPIGYRARERTGYPTQKPLALLERIIKASSNPGDVVLDPFCGCATTCIAAEKFGRQWVGIDISPRAVELVRLRLERELGLDERQGILGKVIHRTDIPRPSETLPNYRTHRHTLYGQQEGLCNGCLTHFPFRNMTVDHIVAQSQGGSDHLENLQLLCNFCNSVKGANSQAYLITRLEEIAHT